MGTRHVSYRKQEMLALLDQMDLQLIYCGVRVAHYFLIFCALFCLYLFCVLWPMFRVSLLYPFVVVPLVFSYVYVLSLNKYNIYRQDVKSI